ncbi:MAG: GNAT family N-acetyltransferase [Actinomycetota bacterium]|nr:GNAT family N-acetyltransferase [Actinomycetota bacterium]
MGVEIRDNSAVRAGLAEYTIEGDRISLTHTETSPEFAGRGLAKQLIIFALESARERGLQVLPFCPYALRVIADNPETFLDLVPADARVQFNLPEAQ